MMQDLKHVFLVVPTKCLLTFMLTKMQKNVFSNIRSQHSWKSVEQIYGDSLQSRRPGQGHRRSLTLRILI